MKVLKGCRKDLVITRGGYVKLEMSLWTTIDFIGNVPSLSVWSGPSS